MATSAAARARAAAAGGGDDDDPVAGAVADLTFGQYWFPCSFFHAWAFRAGQAV